MRHPGFISDNVAGTKCLTNRTSNLRKASFPLRSFFGSERALDHAREGFSVRRTTTECDYEQMPIEQSFSEPGEPEPPFKMYPASPAMSARAVVVIDGPGMDMQICEFESKEAAAFYLSTLNQVYSRGQVEGHVSAEQASAGVWTRLGSLVQTLRKEISLEPAQVATARAK